MFNFVTALEDDLNTPRAIAALFLQAREINRLGDVPEALELARQLRASGEMLGLLSHDPAEWFVQGSSGEVEADEIDALLVRRAAARDAGDFSEADWIRDELTALGVVIEDGPDGTRWRRVGS